MNLCFIYKINFYFSKAEQVISWVIYGKLVNTVNTGQIKSQPGSGSHNLHLICENDTHVC